MEIQFYGANCVRLTTKKASIVIDDNLAGLGLSSVTKPADIVLFTSDQQGKIKLPNSVVIDTPGEYEVSDISIKGIATQAHMDEAGSPSTATIFKIIADDMRIVVTGHIFPKLTDSQLEALGTTDVLIIPIGNAGYTLDSVGALHLIKEIEPKIIIPTHYADKAIKYLVPQQPLEEAIKGLAMEPKETLPKLKLKPGEITEVTQLIILERQ